MFDMNEMAVFVKVVEAGSFIQASRLLDIPTTTVSRKVAQLESNLGVRLLHRTTRKLHLTEPGAAYYQRCSAILDQVEEANLAAAESQAKPQGMLRLAAPVLFGTTIVSTWISEFLQSNNQIQLEVILSNQHIDLVQEGVDVAFFLGPLKNSSLVARKLGTLPYTVCASPAYLKNHGKPNTPQELSKHACISVTTIVDQTTWEFTSPHQAVQVSPLLKVNDFVFAQRATREGLGITLLPNYLATNDISTGRLETVLDKWQPSSANIYTVFPSRRYISPKVRAFLDFVEEKVAIRPPWII